VVGVAEAVGAALLGAGVTPLIAEPAEASRPAGRAPRRPIATPIRSIVAVRFVRSCARTSAPVTKRWFASAICCSSSAKFRFTSSTAWSGTLGSSSLILGQETVGVAALADSVCPARR
jgi:hypothetical protein